MSYVIIGKKKKVSLPSSWNDLTPKQLLFMAKICKHEMYVTKLEVMMVLYVLNARASLRQENDSENYWLHYHGRRYRTTFKDMVALGNHFSFLVSPIGDTNRYTIDSNLTVDPFPSFRVGLFHRFHGSGEIMEKATYEQFIYCLVYQHEMQQDPNALDKLLACIWFTSDKFDASRVDDDARLLSSLSIEQRNVMLWFWLGTSHFIQQRYPRLFSAEGSKGGNIFEEQLRVVDALAGGDMTKKPLVRDGYLYDALLSMDESVRRSEELLKSK